MTISNAYPIIDGMAPSWADIVVSLTPKGAPLIKTQGIKSIKRTRTVTVGEQKGATGGQVVKHTAGELKLGLDLELYRDEWNSMIEKFAALAPKRGNQVAIRYVVFGIQVQHTPFGSSRIYDWRAKGCFLLGDTLDAKEGTEADTVAVPVGVKQIVDMINGVEVVYL